MDNLSRPTPEAVRPTSEDEELGIIEVDAVLKRTQQNVMNSQDVQFENIFDTVNEDYNESCFKASCFDGFVIQKNLPIVYTAMHGVGHFFISQIFERFKMPKCVPVLEQVEHDPDFPTVRFPNPEEGKSALVFLRLF